MLCFETMFGGTDRKAPTDTTDSVSLRAEPEPELQGARVVTGAVSPTVETVPTRAELCHTLAGALSALATQVTQLGFFKEVRHCVMLVCSRR